MRIRKEKKILPIFDIPICVLDYFSSKVPILWSRSFKSIFVTMLHNDDHLLQDFSKVDCTVFVFYFSLSWNNRSQKMIPNYTRFPAEMCHPVLYKANATRTVTEREVTMHLMDVVSRLIHDVSRRMIWTVGIQDKIRIVRWILRPWRPHFPEPSKIVSSSRHDLLLWLNLQLDEVGCRQASYSLDWVLSVFLFLFCYYWFSFLNSLKFTSGFKWLSSIGSIVIALENWLSSYKKYITLTAIL